MSLLPRFFSWALESLYPAGGNPWNAQPTKVAPAGDIFTPNTGVAAEEQNYLFNQAFANQGLMVTTAINTWCDPVSASAVSGGTTLDVIAWDSANKIWVATGHSSAKLQWSVDDGVNWTTFTTIPSQCDAIGAMPDGSGYSLVLGGSANIQFADLQGNITDCGTHLGTAFTTGAVASALGTSGYVVGVLYDGTNHVARAYGTNNGTTISDLSTAGALTLGLPASWYNGPLNMSYFTSAPGPSGDTVVAFGGTTPVTNPSRMLHITWDGASFTFNDLTLPSAISNKSITGVTYNSTAGLWGVMCYDGTNSQMYVSPDLINWTPMAAPNRLAGGLVSVGPYWITTLAVVILGVTSWRAYASTDALNFYGLSGGWTSYTSSVQKMAQGDGSAAMWSTAGAQISKRIG